MKFHAQTVKLGGFVTGNELVRVWNRQGMGLLLTASAASNIQRRLLPSTLAQCTVSVST